MTKPRSTLKDYFTKGKIPKESHFADLIDSMVNQEDDKLTIESGTGKVLINGPLGLGVKIDKPETRKEKAENIIINAESKSTLSVNGNAVVKDNLTVGGTIKGNVRVIDTRDKDYPPNEYSQEVAFEFKDSSKVDIPTQDAYTTLLTVAPWANDGTGGNHHQVGFNNSGLFWRKGENNKEKWQNWTRLATSGMTDDFYFNGKMGIGTKEPKAKLQVVGGAIMPSAGKDEKSGILFPPDPGGGGGDRAWMRYYARSGESMTLAIGTEDNSDDHIALLPSGNVGIGTDTPEAKLEVKGNTKINGELAIGDWIFSSKGNQLLIKYNDKIVANISADGIDCLRIFQNMNGVRPYWYFNTSGNSGLYK